MELSTCSCFIMNYFGTLDMLFCNLNLVVNQKMTVRLQRSMLLLSKPKQLRTAYLIMLSNVCSISDVLKKRSVSSNVLDVLDLNHFIRPAHYDSPCHLINRQLLYSKNVATFLFTVCFIYTDAVVPITK